MSSDYWLGLATIPALLLAIVTGLALYALLFERSSWDTIGCGRCDYELDTKGRPRWLTALIWQKHRLTHRKGITK